MKRECQPCPAGFTTLQTGTSVSTQCKCERPSGVTRRVLITNTCQAGASLRRSIVKRQRQRTHACCRHAPLPSSPTDCAAGFGGSGCPACAIGSYSSGGTLLKQTKACTACSPGMTTGGPGASQSGDCVSGALWPPLHLIDASLPAFASALFFRLHLGSWAWMYVAGRVGQRLLLACSNASLRAALPCILCHLSGYGYGACRVFVTHPRNQGSDPPPPLAPPRSPLAATGRKLMSAGAYSPL